MDNLYRTGIHMAESQSCVAVKELQFTAKSLQSCPTLCDPRDGSHQAPDKPGGPQSMGLQRVGHD